MWSHPLHRSKKEIEIALYQQSQVFGYYIWVSLLFEQQQFLDDYSNWWNFNCLRHCLHDTQGVHNPWNCYFSFTCQTEPLSRLQLCNNSLQWSTRCRDGVKVLWCCSILFGWFLRVPSLHVLVFNWKLFCDSLSNCAVSSTKHMQLMPSILSATM